MTPPEPTLRDLFAAAALHGGIAEKFEMTPDQWAAWAFTIADAMLKAREQKQ